MDRSWKLLRRSRMCRMAGAPDYHAAADKGSSNYEDRSWLVGPQLSCNAECNAACARSYASLLCSRSSVRILVASSGMAVRFPSSICKARGLPLLLCPIASEHDLAPEAVAPMRGITSFQFQRPCTGAHPSFIILPAAQKPKVLSQAPGSALHSQDPVITSTFQVFLSGLVQCALSVSVGFAACSAGGTAAHKHI